MGKFQKTWKVSKSNYSINTTLIIRNGFSPTKTLKPQVGMMECKMTCNPNGMLWPLPTGKVELSKELLHFYPGDLSIEVDDDTSFEVYGLVSKFSNIFKDYLYQMHPNYDLNSKDSPFSDGK